MTTPVNFELAKLLKEKEFDKRCNGCYDEKGIYGFTAMSIKQYYTNSKEDTWNFAAPTIAEVIMWLYEKHGIWISVDMVFEEQQTGFWYCIRQKKPDDFAVQSDEYVTTSEAYEAAIQYCLINLI